MMRNRAIASVFNRFSLSILVLMFALGVYAILASSRMVWQALGTMVVIIVGLIFCAPAFLALDARAVAEILRRE